MSAQQAGKTVEHGIVGRADVVRHTLAWRGRLRPAATRSLAVAIRLVVSHTDFWDLLNKAANWVTLWVGSVDDGGGR